MSAILHFRRTRPHYYISHWSIPSSATHMHLTHTHLLWWDSFPKALELHLPERTRHLSWSKAWRAFIVAFVAQADTLCRGVHRRLLMAKGNCLLKSSFFFCRNTHKDIPLHYHQKIHNRLPKITISSCDIGASPRSRMSRQLMSNPWRLRQRCLQWM